MEEGLQKILDRICAKEVHELTENDKAILRARSDYIGRRNRDKFKSVFGEKPAPVEVKEPEVSNPNPDTSEFKTDPTDDGVDE